jgi:stage III sporulation protein SpoIIIAA
VVGKTTLLRDVARIRLETIGKGLCVVDSIRELCGFGAIPHPSLRRANIFPVGHPSRQERQLQEAETIRNHSAKEVLMGEVQTGDIPLLLEAHQNGTTVACSLHGRSITSLVRHIHRRSLLGVIENPRDGVVSQREDNIFSLIIEVHGKGLFRVITDVDAAIDAVQHRRPVEYTYFGLWATAWSRSGASPTASGR